jgi:hypothetical protein
LCHSCLDLLGVWTSPGCLDLRSHKYKQMQIEFEKQPEEKYLAMLKEAGWTDRTESEGI